MSADQETSTLANEQRRAIDIHRSTGALITHSYLDRKQEFVAVNKTDLEDILEFDSVAATQFAIAMFLISGATWLLVDKVTQMSVFTITAVVGMCIVSILAGLGFLYSGVRMHLRKRGRIQRIFEETTPIGKPR